jgi:hypothetical protein
MKGRSLLKQPNVINFVMAFIHEGSCECASTGLDLFSVPPTQTSVESGKYVKYRPVSTLQNGSPIEFDIASSGDDYIDFANSYLHLKVKITRANGNNLADDDAVGPVNNFYTLYFHKSMSFSMEVWSQVHQIFTHTGHTLKTC